MLWRRGIVDRTLFFVLCVCVFLILILLCLIDERERERERIDDEEPKWAGGRATSAI